MNDHLDADETLTITAADLAPLVLLAEAYKRGMVGGPPLTQDEQAADAEPQR